MKQILTVLIFCILGTLTAYADETELRALETSQDGRGWEGVGRLDIRGEGFCTAALIRDQLILTAAHCLYYDNGDLIPADRFQFNAGLRNGRSEATRQVTRAVAHPDYVASGNNSRAGNVAMDIAVLELDRPIRTTRIRPFPVSAQPRSGDTVGVVSYGQGRAEAPSLQEVCSIMGRQTGILIMTCDVEFGSSGSPVFMVKDGITSIASVVSALAEVGGQQVSLGTSLQEPLATLLSHFSAIGPARPGGIQRVINVEERNDTGAKFVRP